MDRVATGAARCFRMGGPVFFILFKPVAFGPRSELARDGAQALYSFFLHLFALSLPRFSILLKFCRVQLRNNSNSAEALRNHQLFCAKQWVVSKLILFYLLEPFLGEGDFICSNHCSERGVWCRTGVWRCSLYGSSSQS